MIADRCEINRQIRADNRILRELKTQIKKLVQAVEKSIPVIAETLEAIRNHMIFTQYHLLHNEMQKEVIHDWMQHFRPIKYLVPLSVDSSRSVYALTLYAILLSSCKK